MRNLKTNTLIFELSKPGRRGAKLPACDVPSPEVNQLLPASALASAPPPLPEVAEPEVVRHFTNLSTLNMSVDTHFYPLGSCTMKYNSKRNERIAALPGLAELHPYQPESSLQGILQIFFELLQFFGEISGLPAVSLQPAAGAHGELTALMVAAAHFRAIGQKRTKILAPDSAHGTNPASAKMAGFEFVTIKSTPQGNVDMDDLRAKLDDTVAVFMITNPNTLGMFDKQVGEICKLVHDHGGLIYLDGANMNAILGIARPGDFGADMMHYNPHKTFSGPHGGGGPGAGPICVTETLRPYLPCPTVEQSDDVYRLVYDNPTTIGRVRSFFGNVGVLIRAYCYIRTHGPDGLTRVSETAVLNANYLLSKVKHFLPVPQGPRCMHEFVASGAALKKAKGISAMDVAKRLLDYGFHAPTVYFPLTVAEAMMIEPTETESKETLDSFAEVLFRITEESGDLLHEAPHSTLISRPDEVRAARQPIIKWTSANAWAACAMVDYDSPWKEALDGYLQSFIALFFPVMHDEIDWSRGYETLDKELQQITPDAEDGRRYVDKLVQVWRLNGEPEWVLIHVEVQGQEEAAFAQRMFVYNCRLVERYNKPVVSLAVLADENPNWMPSMFRRELWGCSTEFRFPIVKLLAEATRAEELERSDNPFAWFVLAHIKAVETRRDDQSRYAWKLRLVRNLFERGLSADAIRSLFRLIDWVITLPPELVRVFQDDLSEIQEKNHMPYVTSIERLAKEDGIAEGLQLAFKRGIRNILEARFGEGGLALYPEIDAITDDKQLEAMQKQAAIAASLDELRKLWN